MTLPKELTVNVDSSVDIPEPHLSMAFDREGYQSDGIPPASTVASLVQEHQAHMRRCLKNLMVQHECLVYNATQLLQQNLESLLGNALTERPTSESVPQSDAGPCSSLPHDHETCSLLPNVKNEGHWVPPPVTEGADINLWSGILEEGTESQQNVKSYSGEHHDVFLHTVVQKARSALFKPTSADSQVIAVATSHNEVKKMSCISRCVHSWLFEGVVSAFIVANAIFLGFQVQLHDRASLVEGTVQIMFCCVFTVELCLRICAQPRRFFSHDYIWNLFDAVTVISSLTEVFINLAFAGHAHGNIVILRVLRLLKALRVALVFKVEAFRELRLMVHSVVHCLKPLTWTLMLLLVIVYMFAVIFTQVVQERLSSGHESSYDEELTLYFSSTVASVRTLLAAILGGKDWVDFATPLRSLHWAYELFFYLYVIFTHLALLNVVTGIFVDSSMNSALHDKQIAIQNELLRQGLHKKELSQLFEEAADGKAIISIHVMEEYLKDERVRTYLKVLDVSYNDPKDLIHCLDADANCMIDYDEFVKGCTVLASQNLSDMSSTLQENKRVCHSIMESLLNLQYKVDVQLSKIPLAGPKKTSRNSMVETLTSLVVSTHEEPSDNPMVGTAISFI